MIKKTLVFIKHCLEYLYFNIMPKRRFVFEGKEYKYFYAFYNATWTAERKIEIPIFLDILNSAKGKKILEVGNVLAHYSSIKHTVVDKYEVAPRVINEDIVDFHPNEKYELILSISTLEHVGFDEPKIEPKKTMKSIQNLIKLLKPGGRLIFSFPLKYNPNLDKVVEQGKIKLYKKSEISVISQGLTKHPAKRLCIVEIRK